MADVPRYLSGIFNPQPQTMKLMYFPITALGEPIRMMFSLSGVALEDERIPGKEWGDRKAEMPYGQMLVLTITEDPVQASGSSDCGSGTHSPRAGSSRHVGHCL